MFNCITGNYEINAYNETAISTLENALAFNKLEYNKYGSSVYNMTTRETEKKGSMFIIKPKTRKEKELTKNILNAMKDLFIDGVEL